MKRMQGRVVLVTGAAGGIGRAHCLRLAGEGAAIIATDLEAAADGLQETAAAVAAQGKQCVAASSDVRDLSSVESVVAQGVDRLGELDGVVANAGIYPTAAFSWEIDDEDWQRTLDVNLTGAWHTVKAAAPAMAGGAIVLIGSTSGVRGSGATSHYSASKHGVVGLAQTLANELAGRGIRVNMVLPGSVGTPMILNDSVFAKLRPELESPGQDDAATVLASRTLLDTPWVDPIDVSNASLFLLSDEARYVTGTTIAVDAGLLAKVS